MNENEELRLVISTDTVPGKGLPAEIAFNYEELKKSLASHVAKYDGLVVRDDDIAGARKVRAEVNGIINALTVAGRDVKKRWNAPLDAFLGRVKELVGIAKPIEAKIGGQIREYDAAKREEKRSRIAQMITGLVNEAVKEEQDEEVAAAFVGSGHWSSCIKDEMLAQSASMSRIRTTLEAEVRRCMNQVETARRLYGPRGGMWFAKACLSLARWDYDAKTAFGETDRAIEEEERIQRRRAEADARRRAAEEEAKARLAERRAGVATSHASASAHAEPSHAAKQPDECATSQATVAEDPVMSYSIRITGHKSKLFALRRWIDESGLKFERI